MRASVRLTVALVTCAFASTAVAWEKHAYQMRDQPGIHSFQEQRLQYYYYVPCPEYSWFWGFHGWEPGDIIGVFFTIGDISTGGWPACDPLQCHSIEGIRILDFAGYGVTYPGLFTIEFDIYCSDSLGCPVGVSLWNSGPVEFEYGWNYTMLETLISVTPCVIDTGPPPSGPRILVTATHTGSFGKYPSWGFDNISTAAFGEPPCDMHDTGCLPALYPRPYVSHYSRIHSGYYGNLSFDYCPSWWFKDGRDTTDDGREFGYLELVWRLYIACRGPDVAKPTTWGAIKSMYR